MKMSWRIFKQDSVLHQISSNTLIFFSKNHVYKNVEAQIAKKIRTSHCKDFEPKPRSFQWRVARALEPFFEPIPLNRLRMKKIEPNVSHEDIFFMTS